MTCFLIFAASFGTTFLMWPGRGHFDEWFDKEGIGWFVVAIPVWFLIASWCGLPFPINEGD